MSRNIPELTNSKNEMYRSMGDKWENVLRVACPGIINSFDTKTQTCTVQLALREEVIKQNYSTEWTNIPMLLDVPIVIPRAGGYCLTMPINPGDECLVIFADMCIDSWFSLGGIQNQIDKRRHDLSDSFAVLGTWSQPNVIPNYSMDSVQLRNDKGNSYIGLKDNEINIVSDTVKINGTEIKALQQD